MTETEWLTLIDSHPLLRSWTVRRRDHGWPLMPRPNDRKLRLFACGCVRLFSGLIEDARVSQACEITERFAEARTNPERNQIKEARRIARSAFAESTSPPGLWNGVGTAYLLIDPMVMIDAAMAAMHTSDRIRSIFHGREPAALLRCIIGNPFRPVTFDPRWRSETAVALASAIYAERAFDRLPILADALEEAGCDHPDVLTHCRGPGPHARGCWVVDLVLDKS